MARKIGIWGIVITVIALAFLFKGKYSNSCDSNTNITVSIINPFTISCSEFNELKISKNKGTNKYEKTLIVRFNNVIDYVVKIDEGAKARGYLTPEEEYEINRLGNLFSDYAIDNLNHISYSLVEELMCKVGMIEEINSANPPHSAPFQEQYYEEAPLIEWN